MTRKIKPYKPQKKEHRVQLETVPVSIRPNWRLLLGIILLALLFLYSYFQIQKQQSAFRIAELQEQVRERATRLQQEQNRYMELASFPRVARIATHTLGMIQGAEAPRVLLADWDSEQPILAREEPLYTLGQ